ncbi:MAG: phosphoribosyltransferase family protein [Salegentibacter sp.]
MFHDFLDLLYPRLCNCCSEELVRNEESICTSCLHELPVTNFHLEKENLALKIFYGRANIENAACLLFFYKKGMVQNLIHNLKYRGHQEVGSFLGKWMGSELSGVEDFRRTDAVIPVPLHSKKLKSRGFNQVEGFARELAASLNAEYVDDVLLKKTNTGTQTIKKRLARWGSIEETFVLENSEKLRNKHILLVDDLLTTGATLEACAHRLEKIEGISISIATMAITA